MSEAIEMRVKRNRLTTIIVGALVYLAFGMIQITLVAGFDYPFNGLGGIIGVASIIAAVVLLFKVHAAENAGYTRTLDEWLGTEHKDPPLEEWAESLEERGEFASLHSPVRVKTDGGENES